MSVILVFLLVIAGIAGWWLSHQRLMAKPWLEQGMRRAISSPDRVGAMPAAKIGLGVFLAVVGCLFALFISAYFMRMGLSDWRPMPVPRLLWLNTGVLVLSSVALQCALVAARRRADWTRCGSASSPAGSPRSPSWSASLMAGGNWPPTAICLAGNPANSFFYLITGMHGLHIVGRPGRRWRTTAGALDAGVAAGAAAPQRRAVRHLLALPAVRLARPSSLLLAGWAANFIDICRQLLT